MPEAAARPDSTPAGLPPADRCDGIAGDAETTTGPPKGWAAAVTLIEALTERGEALLADRDQARRIAVALESEVAALTDALGDPDVTHEYEPCCNGDGMLASGYSHGSHPSPFETFCMAKDADGFQCLARYNVPVHRTPARVREELEGQ